MITFKDLNFYLDKLNNDEPFVFARYGDGEWAAMLKQPGMNCDHHLYYPEMGDDLLKSLNRCTEPNYLFGMQPLAITVYGQDINRVLVEKHLDINWLNSDVFHNASIEGKLFPLIEALRKHKVVYIGPSYLSKISRIFPVEKFIEVPGENCYLKKEQIKKDILDYGEKAVYLFSASMLTEVLLDEIYDSLRGSTLIDVGSLFDPFVDKSTRVYHNEIKGDLRDKNIGL